MGRPRTVNLNCPPGMHPRRRGKITYYYYITPDREVPLGTDYALALKKWAEFEIDGKEVLPSVLTFRYVAEKYRLKVIPTKAPRTQADNKKELDNLIKFFDNPPAPLESIRPVHIRQYLTWRGSAPVRANREKALFSHVWNWCRDVGYTDLPNPCEGIHGYTETGRDVYVDSDVYLAISAEGCEPLREAMDLAYVTGQRPADMLRYREQDTRDGVLPTRQGKTAAKLRMAIEGALEDVLKRIRARKAKMTVHCMNLLVTVKGKPLKQWNLRRMFDEARAAAAKTAAAAAAAQTTEEGRNSDLAARIRAVQFKDLRGKAGTDRAEDEGILAAKDLLGHTTVRMTEHYVKNRRGKLIKPMSAVVLEERKSIGKIGPAK